MFSFFYEYDDDVGVKFIKNKDAPLLKRGKTHKRIEDDVKVYSEGFHDIETEIEMELKQPVPSDVGDIEPSCSSKSEPTQSLTAEPSYSFKSFCSSTSHGQGGDTDVESDSDSDSDDGDRYMLDEDEFTEMTRMIDWNDIKDIIFNTINDAQRIDYTYSKTKKEREQTRAMKRKAEIEEAERKAEEERGWSLTEMLKKTQLLALFLNTTDWEEDLFESYMRLDLPGIDANELTPKERAFLETKLLESFNKIMTSLDYSIVSNFFAAKTQEEQEDAYVGSPHDWDAFLDDILCGADIDRSLLSPDLISKLNEIGRGSFVYLGINSPLRLKHSFWIINKNQNAGAEPSSQIMRMWQSDFRRVLRKEGANMFPIFEDMQPCTITVERVTVLGKPSAGSSPSHSGWREKLVSDLIKHDKQPSRRNRKSSSRNRRKIEN